MSRYRLWLPVVFGAVAAVLASFDVYNSHLAIARHTGAPVWPYRTPELLMPALYWPAYVLVSPVFWAVGPFIFWIHYLVLFPVILVWWNLIGRRFDFDLVPRSWLGGDKAVALVPALACVGLAAFGLSGLVEGIEWWNRYGTSLWPAQLILLINQVGPAIWCFVLSVWLGAVAIKIRAEASDAFSVRRIILGGLASNVLFATCFIASEYLLNRTGAVDWAVLSLASFGILPFYRPESAARTTIVALYNIVSNVFLAMLIVYGVFGLAL